MGNRRSDEETPASDDSRTCLRALEVQEKGPGRKVFCSQEWKEEEYDAIEISLEEYKKIIGKLKPGKAQDYLGLSNDLLKRAHPDMIKLLHELTDDCLKAKDYGGIVINYGKGTIIIKKPGRPVTDIKNWRKTKKCANFALRN